jgi:hypothetical protein
MKTKTIAVFGLAVALSSAALAGPDVPPTIPPPPPPALGAAGFYIGSDAGVFLLQDRSLDVGGLPISADAHYKTGWGIDVPLGYNFGNGLSVGASAGYYAADVNSVTVTRTGGFGFGHHFGHGGSATFPGNGSEEMVPLLAEVSYSVPIAGPLSWNIGGGLGTAYTRSTSYGNVYDEEWDFADCWRDPRVPPAAFLRSPTAPPGHPLSESLCVPSGHSKGRE